MTQHPATGVWKWMPLVAFGGYFFVSLYIVGPLRIRRRQTVPVKDRFDLIDLTNLPGDAPAIFAKYITWLAELGFQSLGTVHRPNATTQRKMYITTAIASGLGDSVQLIGVVSPSPVTRYSVLTSVTFRTEFTDGTAIYTTNSAGPPFLPGDPKVAMVSAAGVGDVGMLYRFHRARVDRDSAGRTATLDRVSGAVERLELDHATTYARLIASGHYRVNETKQVYLPTIAGAYRMSWRLLFPFKQIALRRRRQRVEKTLRDLGFGDLASLRRAKSERAIAPPPVNVVPVDSGDAG